MKRSLWVLFGMFFLLLPLSGYLAFGGAPLDPEIEAKIKGQETEIQDALKSKQMGPEEAGKLQDNLTDIRQRANSAQSEGKLTADQKNQFFQSLEQNSQAIESKKSERTKAMRQLMGPQLMGPMQTLQGREIKQQKMLNHGVETNRLTQGEADVLKANIENIKNEEERLRAENKLTAEEQARLFKMFDANEAMIRDKQKNPVKALFTAGQGKLGTPTKPLPPGKPGSQGH